MGCDRHYSSIFFADDDAKKRRNNLRSAVRFKIFPERLVLSEVVQASLDFGKIVFEFRFVFDD